jgi:hypothetical protein
MKIPLGDLGGWPAGRRRRYQAQQLELFGNGVSAARAGRAQQQSLDGPSSPQSEPATLKDSGAVARLHMTFVLSGAHRELAMAGGSSQSVRPRSGSPVASESALTTGEQNALNKGNR